jgi:hypothetical protein
MGMCEWPGANNGRLRRRVSIVRGQAAVGQEWSYVIVQGRLHTFFDRWQKVAEGCPVR